MIKKLLPLLICGLLLGCSPSNYDDSSLWDSVNSLENRLATLEVLMKAVDKNLYILSVKPTENGYVITFSDNSQITILNGKDGADGDDGDDGKNGIIKVTQDDDNVYFELSDGSVITIPKNGKAPGSDEIILFEDTIAHDICVNLWDTNNDGQLSYAEAAAVKSIGMVFKGKEIVNFKEFQYFTGVTAIEASAFYGCSKLTKIGIPKNIQSIGNDAFWGNIIRSVYISNLNAWCKIKWDGVYQGSLSGYDLYLNNELVTDITVPDGITEIGDRAFCGCLSLKSVTIPNGVTSIGEWAFALCNLTSITIPNSVISIGKMAFALCRLTSITIPNSVISIGEGTFSTCSRLTSITIPDSVTEIGASAFSDCSSLTSVTIPNSVTSIGVPAFDGCSNLKSIYCKSTAPPQLTGDCQPFPYSTTIYVPSASVNSYKAASGWRNYADQIVGYDFD